MFAAVSALFEFYSTNEKTDKKMLENTQIQRHSVIFTSIIKTMLVEKNLVHLFFKTSYSIRQHN
jgi:hypothetical protein